MHRAACCCRYTHPASRVPCGKSPRDDTLPCKLSAASNNFGDYDAVLLRIALPVCALQPGASRATASLRLCLHLGRGPRRKSTTPDALLPSSRRPCAQFPLLGPFSSFGRPDSYLGFSSWASERRLPSLLHALPPAQPRPYLTLAAYRELLWTSLIRHHTLASEVPCPLAGWPQPKIDRVRSTKRYVVP